MSLAILTQGNELFGLGTFLFDCEEPVYYIGTSCGVCFLSMFLVKTFLIYDQRKCVCQALRLTQMYAELNKTSPCSRFWEDEKSDSG